MRRKRRKMRNEGHGRSGAEDEKENIKKNRRKKWSGLGGKILKWR